MGLDGPSLVGLGENSELVAIDDLKANVVPLCLCVADVARLHRQVGSKLLGYLFCAWQRWNESENVRERWTESLGSGILLGSYSCHVAAKDTLLRQASLANLLFF